MREHGGDFVAARAFDVHELEKKLILLIFLDPVSFNFFINKNRLRMSSGAAPIASACASGAPSQDPGSAGQQPMAFLSLLNSL